MNRPTPQIKTVQHVPIPKFSQTKLKNGIPLIIVDKGTTPALNLIVEFRAGRFLETNRLTSNVCASLLKEGSQQYTGSEIDEIFDFLGATIQVSSNLDFIKLSVYCLTKHLELLLPYILDIILYPTFSDKELKRYKKNVKNQLIINLDKKNIIAYRELTEKLFGKAHPYGYNSTIEGYEALQREQVKDFHKKVFIAEQCKVYVAGGLEENTIDLLEQSLQEIPNGTKLVAPTFETPSEVPNRVTIKGKKSNQAAIRMGWRSIGKAHPDYPDLLILNTILGGFFGSRLMTNIREEKGYTYNIFSSIDAMLYDAYFYIGAEVNRENLDQVLIEIEREIEKLKTEPIRDEELTMLKNYLLGTLLNMVDGPFYIAQTVRSFYSYDLPISSFEQMVEATKNITKERMQSLANKYLNMKHICCVTVL